MPAVFSVYLITPGSGVPGDSAATITGTIAMRSGFERDPMGLVYVEAASAQDALVQVLEGSMTVTFNGNTDTYAFNSSTLGTSASQLRPFLLTPGGVLFEDMTLNPSFCDYDYDYNDRSLVIDVREYPSGVPYPLAVDVSAYGDFYEGSEDAVFSVDALNGVLINDHIGSSPPMPDGPPPPGAGLSAQLVESTDFGTLNLQSDGSFQYTPNADYSGFDTFIYRASNGVGISYYAYVTIQIERVIDDEVIALDDFATFELDTPVSGDVVLNDTDYTEQTAVVTLDAGPAHGNVTLNQSGGFTYTPNAGSILDDSFVYKFTNSAGKIDFGTVFIQAKPVQSGYETIALNAQYSVPANAPTETEEVHNSETNAKKRVVSIAYHEFVRAHVGSLVSYPPVNLGVKAALQATLPNATEFLKHFTDNVGTEKAIDIVSFLELKTTNALRNKEIERAKQFAETLAIGQYKIQSTAANLTGVESKESQDWNKAVGQYHSWGRGTLTVTDAGNGLKTYVLVHEYVVRDRYNFNAGETFNLGLKVYADDLIQLVKSGLAKNFDALGGAETTITWTK